VLIFVTCAQSVLELTIQQIVKHEDSQHFASSNL